MTRAPDTTPAAPLTVRARAGDRDGTWLLLAARLVAGLVLAIALVVVVAWAVGLDSAIRLMPGLPAMKLNTAISFAMLAIALHSLAGGLERWVTPRASLRIASGAALGAGLITLLTITEMLTGVPLRIDELLVADRTDPTGMNVPGRMAPGTATSLLLLAIASLSCRWTATQPRARWVVRVCSAGAMGMGLLAGSALLLSAGGLTNIPFFSTMALHTAWLLVLLGGGTVLAERGLRGCASPKQPDPARLRSERRLAMAVVATLALGLLTTLLIGYRTQMRDQEAARLRFDRLTDRIASEARRRLELPVYGLKGARGVYAASKSVERREFRQYVASRDLRQEFPGAIGMGFIQRVPRNELDAFLAAEQADDAPDFSVKIPMVSLRPPTNPALDAGLADDLFIIKFIEPLAENAAAWGYDVGSEPVRRAALERAVRTGEATLTGRISLLQDDRERAGFLFLVPVYRNGAVISTEADRFRSLQGLVYAPLVIDEIFRGVEEAAEGNLDFEVFEGERATADSLLFDLDGHLRRQAGGDVAAAYAERMFDRLIPLHVGGRVWTIRASTTPQFHASAVTTQPLMATMAGLLLTTLVAGLVWTRGRSQVRAQELAVVMTEDLRRATAELERMARTDKLTGLPNRALLLDRIGQAMKRFARRRDRAYAVLFLDFDRFKIVNDTLGHEAGDQLLIQIAGRLRQQLRTTDSIALAADGHTAARIGGDEFVVLLDDLAAPADATVVATRLVEAFATPYQIAGQPVVSTASIGVAIGDEGYAQPDEALRDADLAMYEAKTAGKGRYVLFDAAMREKLLRRVGLERDLHRAVELGQLTMHYQPIVKIESGAIDRIEALARWHHPLMDSIEPTEFIPIAEDSGQIVQLGEWFLREASAQAAAWHRRFGAGNAPVVAVNLSRKQLALPDLAERLTAIVRSAGARPGQICLEVTETAVMLDRTRSIAQLKGLKAAGFMIALDDFGTGQSSLSSLHMLPLDVVKLDRAFIAQCGQRRAHAAMMQAVVSLASNLGMTVVAEGVETPEQLAMLQALDCQHAQGHHFGSPVPAAEIRFDTGPRRAAA